MAITLKRKNYTRMSKRLPIALVAMATVVAFGQEAAPEAAVAEPAPAIEAPAPAAEAAVEAAAEAVAVAAEEVAEAAEEAPAVVEVTEVTEDEKAAGEDVPVEEDIIPGAKVMDSSDSSKISLSLDAVELPDVVRLFTRLSGANIICNTTNLAGTVTANLNEVDWQAALKHILDLQGLELAEKPAGSGIFVISAVAPDAPPKTFTRTFKLDFIKANEAKTVIEGILGLDKASSAKKSAANTKKGDDEKDNAETAVMENGRVVSYPAANKLVVTSTEEKLLEVAEVLKEIDIERPQVYIEAKIVEISGDARKAVGLDWSFLDGYTISAGPFSRRYTKAGNRNAGSTRASTQNNAFFNRNYDSSEAEYPDSLAGASDYEGRVEDSPWSSVYRLKSITGAAGKTSVWTTDVNGQTSARGTAVSDVKTAIFDLPALEVALSALQTSDDVAQISNPRLVVANEERAVIDMSTKDPYVKVDETVEGTGTDTTRKYSVTMDKIPVDKDVPYIEGAFFSYGIRVDVTPRVNNSTNITVVIEPTLSDRQTYYAPGDGNTRFPVITSKSVKTTFSLGNGQTAVIGGLTTTKDREVEKKVPILGSIPILGYLFRHNVKEKQQVETIIFVTVGLVDSNNRESAMALPDGARLVQKRISADGKIIDKRFKEFEKDEDKEDAARIEKAKADGLYVPAAVEE